MARSKIDICNMALARAGVSFFISSLDDATNEARVLKAFYSSTLERILAELPWQFATAYVALQSLGSPPVGWGFRYAYPTDCITARRVIFDASDKVSRYPFIVVSDIDNNSLALLTNVETATLEYTTAHTSLVDNPSVFSAPFADAFAWALTAEIASPLAANPSLGLAARQAYQATVSTAFAHDQNQAVESPEPASSFERARA